MFLPYWICFCRRFITAALVSVLAGSGMRGWQRPRGGLQGPDIGSITKDTLWSVWPLVAPWVNYFFSSGFLISLHLVHKDAQSHAWWFHCLTFWNVTATKSQRGRPQALMSSTPCVGHWFWRDFLLLDFLLNYFNAGSNTLNSIHLICIKKGGSRHKNLNIKSKLFAISFCVLVELPL